MIPLINFAVLFIPFGTANNEMKSSYKYLQLNAEVHFKEIVSEARSVILAGGTLQPVSHALHLQVYWLNSIYYRSAF